MWNRLEGLAGAKRREGGRREVWGGGGEGGAAGLGGDERRGALWYSLPRQLISASCWRLAGRKRSAGGLALETRCSTPSTENNRPHNRVHIWLFTLACSSLAPSPRKDCDSVAILMSGETRGI